MKAKRKSVDRRWTSTWHPSPLKSSFMLASMLGFLISGYLLYDKFPNFALSFMLLFALMFIASVISMTKAPITKEEF